VSTCVYTGQEALLAGNRNEPARRAYRFKEDEHGRFRDEVGTRRSLGDAVTRPTWERLGGPPGEGWKRAALSLVAAAGGIVYLVITITSVEGSWTKFIWPAAYLFVAWRFVGFGVYTSEWGVRINNPVLTWWYPWRRIDHFELAPTGELFAPKAQAVALVSTKGRRRSALGLSASRMFFALNDDTQAEIMADLNARSLRENR
jgi:hypothetical protein